MDDSEEPMLRKIGINDGEEVEDSIIITENSDSSKLPPLVWEFLLLLGVFVYGSYSVLIHLCEVDGKLPFSSASVVLVIEISKLALSIILFSSQNWPNLKAAIKESYSLLTWPVVLSFAIPAFLYMINNNLDVVIQLYMDPATYQVLANMKIFTTAILFRIIMKKRISVIQWFALSLLAFSGVLNSIGNFKATVPSLEAIVTSKATLSPESQQKSLYITTSGVIMILIYSLISGFNGVYTEYVLKQQKEMSLHVQNALLYFYGTILNAIYFFYLAFKSPNLATGLDLFRGYTIYTWILIISQSFLGLLMGAIMKHSNNITRLFLISSAIIVSTALSVIVLHITLNIYFICAVCMVIVSIYLYHK